MTESTKELLDKLLEGLDVLERRVSSFGAETGEERAVVDAALQQIAEMRRRLHETRDHSEDAAA